MKVDLSCPIELWEYAFPTTDKQVCSFTFFNLSERPISSVQITITCFNDKDEAISRRVERPMALEAKAREPFVVELSTEGVEIDVIDLAIDKAWFEDGSEWRRVQEARLVEYEPNELPMSRRLEELRYIAGSDAVGFPSSQRNVWICVCGRVNAANEADCRRCGRSKAMVFERFTADAIQQAINGRERELQEKARVAREEASRQEFIRQNRERQNKRRKRKRTAIFCAVIVVSAASYLFVVLGLPELRYQTAISALSSGDATGARATFESLQDYRESQNMIRECDLNIARTGIESGAMPEIDDALALLRTLGTYPGAAELTNEGNYQKALLLIEDKQYTVASDMLAGLGAYRDAKDLYSQTEYKIAAQEMLSGDYEAAHARFTALGAYMDAETQAMECVYVPAMALKSDEAYAEAAEMFSTIDSYKDATAQRMECIYRSGLRAQLAGDYEEAAAQFKQLEGYEDADEQMTNTIYLAANAARDMGNYEMARGLYETVADYQDAAEQINACIYQPAVSLMKDEDYETAAKMLAQIPDYQDAATLYKECLYQPAKAAIEENAYETAIALLEQIEDYSDAARLLNQANYAFGAQLADNGEYSAAIAVFEALDTYSDAADRIKSIEYAQAEEAFQAGRYEEASGQFEALGKYSDAATRVKECAYQMAIQLFDEGALYLAYEAFAAIEGYDPAAKKAQETAYALGEQYMVEEDLGAAAEAFALAGKYEDAADRRLDALYAQAAATMNAGDYQEASEMFDSISNYKDAKTRRDECYDLWLLEKWETATSLYNEGNYAEIVTLLRGLDMDSLPKAYADLLTMYKESNIKMARKLIDEDKALDAYTYLIACKGYKNANELLDKNIYKILGTWETSSGLRYAFYLNGTCVISGELMYFNMLTPYGISTGASPDDLKRTLSYSGGGDDTLTLRDDSTEKQIRLTRVKQAEYSATDGTNAVGMDDEPQDILAEDTLDTQPLYP